MLKANTEILLAFPVFPVLPQPFQAGMTEMPNRLPPPLLF